MTPYARRVLDAVDSIPVGRVLAYSDVAELVGAGTGRSVGTVMARYGDEVPWHRVLYTDGSCARRTRDRQLVLLREEDVPIQGDRGGHGKSPLERPLAGGSALNAFRVAV